MGRLIDTGSELIVRQSAWLAILTVLGIALFVYAGRPKAEVKKRWAVLAVAAMLTWVGIYFVSFRATFTPESGRVYGFLRYNDEIYWTDAGAAVIERRRVKGGTSNYLLVGKQSGGEFEVPLTGLDDAEVRQVAKYVDEQIRKARK